MRHFSVLFLFFFLASALGAEPYRVSCAKGSSSEALIPLVRAIYEELGISAQIVILPAERALRDLNAGLYDADVARAGCSSTEFPNLTFTHIPLCSIDLHAWVLKESTISVDSASDLFGLRLGYVRGLKLAQSFCERENLDALIVNTFDSGVKMLQAGRLDALLSVTPTSCNELARVGQPLPLVLATGDSLHVLNRAHEFLIPKFDAVLLQMKKDGRYASLISCEE